MGEWTNQLRIANYELRIEENYIEKLINQFRITNWGELYRDED